MNLNLSGERALVCGASQGIGAACARELAELGCEVICLARNESKLKQVVASLSKDKANPQHHSYLVADLSQRESLKTTIERELMVEGPISILINNSGGPAAGSLLTAQTEDFEKAIQGHLYTASAITQLLIPGMGKRQFGRVINILSTSVKAPLPDLGVSNTLRWAMASWGKSLSVEVAAMGITVNSVLPGATKTDRLTQLVEIKAKKGGHSIEEEEKKMLKAIPLGRFAGPEEVAALVAFLCTKAAASITGVAIPVDGGRTPCL